MARILKINLIGLFLILLTLFWGREERDELSVATLSEKELEALLAPYPTVELQKMAAAGEEILEWEELLAKTGSHVVDQVLQGQKVLWQMDHYPLDDVFDTETRAQYYYHAHRSGEHGHFHLFLREGEEDYVHLIAISMDEEGKPRSLFTTNQWVTDEGDYDILERKGMVERFYVGHAHPSYVVNRWLNAMVILFRPQIDLLIEEREERLSLPIEVTSEKAISIETQLRIIQELSTCGRDH